MPRQIDRGPADDENPEAVGEGLGGVTGGALGVGLGALLGPAGMIVGGLAGAAGGWWAGRELAHATDDFSDETDEHYRRLHQERHADRCDWNDARGFYNLGRLARRNPDYEGRAFADVEPELRRGWRDEGAGPFQSWEDVRPFVSTGYEEPPR
ncbi:MAG TPA: hypothetical protein VK929_14105 [Longimicrobiales bacterium]|nr:hypothetical protein [Longimicrobiales bacterium]